MDISISYFSILILLGAAQGLFLAFALVSVRSGNLVAHRLLAVLTVVFVLDLADTFLERTQLYVQATYLFGVENPLDLLYGPLVYLYVGALTNPADFSLSTRHWRHFLPGAVGFVLMIPFFTLDAEVKLRLLDGSVAIVSTHLLLAVLGYHIVVLAAVVQMGIYLGLSIRRLLGHARRIRDQFSYTERINLAWVRNLLIIWCSLYLIYCFQILLSFFTPIQEVNQSISDLLMLMIVIMIYTMGYLGLRQPAIFARLQAQSTDSMRKIDNDAPLMEVGATDVEEEKYKKSALDASLSEALLTELLAHMDTQKPYLDGELTLPQLAGQLGISPHYLSQVINERLGQNFFDFVNRYRIEAVKHHLADPAKERVNISTLALDAGFNSKSAFYTAFKKHTGMIPSQFKKSLAIHSAPLP